MGGSLWWKSFPTYFLTGVSVFFYIAMVLLVLLYSIILIKLKKQAHLGEPSANGEEQRTKTNRNVLKMVVAIVSAFFLCWIPFHTIKVIFLAPESPTPSCKLQVFFIFTYFLAYANCAKNPIICLILSRNYRKGLKRLAICWQLNSNCEILAMIT